MKTSKLLTTQYARNVVAYNATKECYIVSKKVYKACERHLNDLERQGTKDFPYVFDEELAYRPIEFIEKFCRPSKGAFKTLALMEWQHFCIGSLYGWIHKEKRTRRFKEGLIYVARKNGKTTVVSGVANYGVSKDKEKGADVLLLANSMKQARLLFDECKHMIKQSPSLSKHFRTLRDAIYFDKTFSKIEPQASDSEKLDGLNTHLGIFDEIHEFKDYKLINVIKNSTGARTQPLIMYITTAGYQLDGPLMEYYEKATDVLDSVITDERTFYFIAELDDPKEIDEPQMWIKANPSMGVSIKLEDMIEEWESRKHIPAERGDFITKRLNMFVNSSEMSFIDYEILIRNNQTIPLEDLRNKRCVGGFDLSNTEDFTAAALVFPLEDRRIAVISHSFVTERKVRLDNEKLPFQEWEQDGLLTIVPGEYVDYQYVLDWFKEQSELYEFDVITYDPANAYRLVEDLQNEGFATELVRQGSMTLSPALKDLKELFLDGKVIYNNNKMLRWYINNVQLIEDRNGNWLPTKQSRYRKIDGFAAMLNAHTQAMKRAGLGLNEHIMNDFSF